LAAIGTIAHKDRPKNNFLICRLSLRESRGFRGAKGDNYFIRLTHNFGEIVFALEGRVFPLPHVRNRDGSEPPRIFPGDSLWAEAVVPVFVSFFVKLFYLVCSHILEVLYDFLGSSA
jgi:hypothetical protein